MLDRRTDVFRQFVAILVHLYTASGAVVALVAAGFVAQGNYRSAFFWMFFAVLVDATDGSLARAFDVNRHVPWVNGRKLDDIVDYLNYTFLPIFLIWHAHWLPRPTWLWCAFPLVTSSLAFVHEDAKEEDRGFFRGFPSYWNVMAFYFAILPGRPGVVLAIVLVLSALSVSPLRFVYPNRPPCWRPFFFGGACLWGAVLFTMLCLFPAVPGWLVQVSLVYPVLYCVLGWYVWWTSIR